MVCSMNRNESSCNTSRAIMRANEDEHPQLQGPIFKLCDIEIHSPQNIQLIFPISAPTTLSGPVLSCSASPS